MWIIEFQSQAKWFVQNRWRRRQQWGNLGEYKVWEASWKVVGGQGFFGKGKLEAVRLGKFSPQRQEQDNPQAKGNSQHQVGNRVNICRGARARRRAISLETDYSAGQPRWHRMRTQWTWGRWQQSSISRCWGKGVESLDPISQNWCLTKEHKKDFLWYKELNSMLGTGNTGQLGRVFALPVPSSELHTLCYGLTSVTPVFRIWRWENLQSKIVLYSGLMVSTMPHKVLSWKKKQTTKKPHTLTESPRDLCTGRTTHKDTLPRDGGGLLNRKLRPFWTNSGNFDKE